MASSLSFSPDLPGYMSHLKKITGSSIPPGSGAQHGRKQFVILCITHQGWLSPCALRPLFSTQEATENNALKCVSWAGAVNRRHPSGQGVDLGEKDTKPVHLSDACLMSYHRGTPFSCFLFVF